MAAAAAAPVARQAQAVLRGRLCDPAFVHSRLRSSPDTNYRWAESIPSPPHRASPEIATNSSLTGALGVVLRSKLKYLVSSSVSEACNNSVLLLGPRGCGKGAVRFPFSSPLPWLPKCRCPVWWNVHVRNWHCVYWFCLFSVGGLKFYFFIQVLDMVLEDLRKEHPDAISVVWLQCVARNVPD